MALDVSADAREATSRARPRARSSTRCETARRRAGRSSTRSAGSAATRRRARDDGEIDFVLCHPERRDRLPRGQGRRDRVPARRVVPATATASASGSEDPFDAGARPPLRPRAQDRRGRRLRAAASSSSSTRSPSPTSRVHELVARARRTAGDHHRPQRPEGRSPSAIERVLAYHRGVAREARPPGDERDGDAARPARARGPDRGADGERVPRRGGGS